MMIRLLAWSAAIAVVATLCGCRGGPATEPFRGDEQVNGWSAFRVFARESPGPLAELEGEWRQAVLDPRERWAYVLDDEARVARLDLRDGTATVAALPPREDGEAWTSVVPGVDPEGRLYVSAVAEHDAALAFRGKLTGPLRHTLFSQDARGRLTSRAQFAIEDQAAPQEVVALAVTTDGVAFVESQDTISLTEIQHLSCLDQRGRVVWSAVSAAEQPRYARMVVQGSSLLVARDWDPVSRSLPIVRMSRTGTPLPVAVLSGSDLIGIDASGNRYVLNRDPRPRDAGGYPPVSISTYSPTGTPAHRFSLPPPLTRDRTDISQPLMVSSAGNLYFVDTSLPGALTIWRLVTH
jgi:hypothetical protein